MLTWKHGLPARLPEGNSPSGVGGVEGLGGGGLFSFLSFSILNHTRKLPIQEVN